MTMTEPRRSGTLIAAVFGFVVGLLLFLMDVRSSAVGLQTLRLKIELTEISEAGITLMLICTGVATWLLIAGKRGTSGA